jgi:hypothetical protein
MDPENINAVASLKNNTPRTIGDMPKLLGLLSYYRRYVPNLPNLPNLPNFFCTEVPRGFGGQVVSPLAFHL